MTNDPRKWVQPPELAPYDSYTNYPGRATELIRHPASAFSDPVTALMRAEVHAQYELLGRLREDGLLRTPPGDHDHWADEACNSRCVVPPRKVQ